MLASPFSEDADVATCLYLSSFRSIINGFMPDLMFFQDFSDVCHGVMCLSWCCAPLSYLCDVEMNHVA